MEIGTKLKEARVAQNLSLESVQDTTKIQKRYLVAIEEGNFHVLPGKFYARAFIKEYATAVGLDSNELLDEYKEEIPANEEEDTEQYTRIQRSRRDTDSPKGPMNFSVFPIIVVILLVVGIFFAAWYFISNSSSIDPANPVETQDETEIIIDDSEGTNTDENQNSDSEGSSEEPSAEDEQSATTEEEPEPDKVEPSLVVTETGTGASPESTFDLNNASEEVKVVIESNGKSYLAFENGNGEKYYAAAFTTENSPLEVDVTGDERIYFNVGNAPDLQITIDGIKLEYPVDETEKVHQKIWVNINPAEE